jgi:hypothetical protein
MRCLPHSLDASVGLGDHPGKVGVGKVGVGEVGQLTALAVQIAPQPLDQVQLGRVGEQPLDHQPVALGGNEGGHLGAAVGGQAVAQRRGLLPPEEASQLAEHAEVERAVEAQGEDLGAALA